MNKQILQTKLALLSETELSILAYDYCRPAYEAHNLNRRISLLADCLAQRQVANLAVPAAFVLQSEWDMVAFYDLLHAAFNDRELKTLCFKYFPEVHEEIAFGMNKRHMIELLLDNCQRQETLDKLERLVLDHNVAKYTRFRDKLKRYV